MQPKRKQKAELKACPYLTFNGNCRQAMLYYKSCIGGRLSFQTLGQTRHGIGMQQKMKACILQATLSKGGLVLLGTDMVPELGLIKGNSVSILLHCSSEASIKKYYKNLSAGGRASQPLTIGTKGTWFGTLTDRFGHHWLLHYHNTQKQKK